jgi:formylmethanofuran dehydrogenase subunit C
MIGLKEQNGIMVLLGNPKDMIGLKEQNGIMVLLGNPKAIHILHSVIFLQ